MGFASRLKESRQKCRYSQSELAKKLDLNQSTIAYWERGQTEPDSQTMRRLADLLDVRVEWLAFGAMPGALAQRPLLSLRDLPVRGTAQGGKHGAFFLTQDAITYVDRPANLVGNPSAFAVWVSGKSMEPRFRPGELLFVNPSKPLSENCFVLVCLRDGNAYVKELIQQNDKYLHLRQYNPNHDIEIAQNKVSAIYRVVGSSEG